MRHAARAAIFDIVVDGVGVAAGGLEGREHRRCLRAARDHKALAKDKILEPALLGYHAVAFGIEIGHGERPAIGRCFGGRYRGACMQQLYSSSCPGLSRTSTSLKRCGPRTWMPGDR